MSELDDTAGLSNQALKAIVIEPAPFRVLLFTSQFSDSKSRRSMVFGLGNGRRPANFCRSYANSTVFANR
jgi:hypothetical protein